MSKHTAAPKPKKAKGKGPKKAPGPKLAAETIKPGIGHNSGKVIPEVGKLIDEMLASDVRVKNEGKLKRDIRNRLKTEFGFLSSSVAHEMRLRKMDKDVRVQFESNHADLKNALGYQAELDFAGTKPTKASESQQPTEAELTSQRPSNEAPEGDEDEVQRPANDDEGEDEDAVINREG